MMTDDKFHITHATTIALNVRGRWVGVMLRGPSGSGKSDVALRMLDHGAILVSDDQTYVRNAEGELIVSAPESPQNLTGILEVRGLGLMKTQFLESCPLGLVVDLVPALDIERLPEEKNIDYLGCAIKHICLTPFEISVCVKLKNALRAEWLELE